MKRQPAKSQIKRYDLSGFATQISKRLSDSKEGHLETWQREEFDRINEVLNGERKNYRVAIRSGHGVGKSFFLAALITYCVVSCPKLAGLATANTGDQFSSTLGLYIRTMSRFLRGRLSIRSNRIFNTLNPEIQVAFRTYNPMTPEAFQGLHGDLVLLVVDEASALPNSLFELLEGATTGGRYIYVITGNPTKVGTYFHSVFPKTDGAVSSWHTRRVSSLDVSIVDTEFNSNFARMYGVDSDEYRVRVLGEFPKNENNEHMLFISKDVEKILKKEVDFGPKLCYYIGIDIATVGASRTVITMLYHNTLTNEIEVVQVTYLKGLTIPDQISQLINNLKVLPPGTSITLVLDYTGIGIAFGQYLTTELRNFKTPPKLITVNFAAKPTYFPALMGEKNMRTWLYTNLKTILQKDITVSFGVNTITTDDLFRLKQTILDLKFDLTNGLIAEPKGASNTHDLLDSLLLALLPLGLTHGFYTS